MGPRAFIWFMIQISVLLWNGIVMSERRCQEPLYRYQRQCYVKCPMGTTPNKGNGTCSDSCPDRKNGMCLFLNRKRPMSYSNIYCPPKMCQPPFDKCFELKCLKSCPHGTYTHNKMCLRHCPADANLMLNDTCVSACPDNKPYIDKSNCVAACFDSHFRLRNTCVEHCPKGYHVFNATCQIGCPADFPYTIEIENNSFCLDRCPVDTVINNTTCVIDCPRDYPLHFNQMCISQCPEQSKYMVISTTSDKTFVKCVSKCPQNLLDEGHVCVDRCSQEKARLNDSCLDTCPQSHPYRYHIGKPFPHHEAGIICKEKCSKTLRILNNNCYDFCPKTTFNYNGSCLNKCPDSSPYHQREQSTIVGQEEISCVSHCSEPYRYPKGETCVRYCWPPSLLQNNTCVDKCSEKFPFQQMRTFYASGGLKCVGNCPETTVTYKHMCLQECPRNSSYMFNRTCLDKCPDSHPLIDIGTRNSCLAVCNNFEYKSMCLGKCPEGLMGYNKSCIRLCPADKPFTDLETRQCVAKCPGIRYNMTCLNKCPNYTYRYLKQCFRQCPAGFYANMIDRTCLEKCPKFHNGSFCFEKCPNMYTLNQKCVSKCPNETRYVITWDRVAYYNYYYNGKKWKWQKIQPKCAESCPSYYFVLEYKCLPFCPKEYNFTFRQECRKQCPPSYLFKRVDVKTVPPLKSIYKCVLECPRSMVYENRMCINQCSTSSKYVVYNKCNKQCPTDRPLHFRYRDGQTNSIKFTCLSHCPEHSHKINTSCVLFCPTELFGFNGNCVKNCPLTHSLNYSKIAEKGFAYFCVRSCPVNTFLMGNSCYDVCPNSTFQYRHACVHQCPISHKFHRHAVVHKDYNSVICEAKCPKFSAFNECVNSCPLNRSFIYKNQCAARCPSMRPLAPKSGDRFCYDTCPNGTLAFRGQHCIENCPSIYVIYNRTCQKICPPKYIYFEDTSQGTLCREKCYDGFVLNGRECVSRCPVTTYNLQGVCQNIKRCPERYPFEETRPQGRTCTDKCLQTNVLHGRYCESGCPFGYVIYNRQCVKHCPEHVPNELHKSAINFQYQIYCYDSCPSGYVSENKACITEKRCYDAGNIIHKGKCIAKCPFNLIVADNTNAHRRFCTGSCPSGYALNDQECILEDNCYNLNKYVLNKRCIKECKFLYYAENDYLKRRKLCGEKCPKDQVLDDQKSLCITEWECHSSGKYLYRGKCISKCPPGHFITEVSFIYKGCSSSCSRNYHNGTHCQECESTHMLYNGSCLEKCPLRLISINLYLKRSCTSADPILIVLLLAVIVNVACVIGSWYVFIYNYADRKAIKLKKMLVKVKDSTNTYDEDETCPLRLDIENNDTSPLMGTSRSSIECASNTCLDISPEICIPPTSIRTEGDGGEIEESLGLLGANERDAIGNEEDINSSNNSDSQPDEITRLKYLEGPKDVLLEQEFYEIHDAPKDVHYDGNSFDSMDSITKLKSTFKECESETSHGQFTNEGNKLDKAALNDEQAVKNGFGEMQDDFNCVTKYENETFRLDPFGKECGKDDSVNLKTEETKT